MFVGIVPIYVRSYNYMQALANTSLQMHVQVWRVERVPMNLGLVTTVIVLVWGIALCNMIGQLSISRLLP